MSRPRFVPQSHVRQNLYLLICLAGAAYLSIAALAAIPVLEESTTGAQEELVLLRDELRAPEREFRSALYEVPSPFQEVDGILTAPIDPQRAISADVRSGLEQEVALAKSNRERLIAEHRSLRARWENRVNRARKTVLASVQSNLDRKGNYERRQYHAQLLTWFDDALSNAERESEECRDAARQIDAAIHVWASATKRAIEREAKLFQPVEVSVDWTALAPQCSQFWEFPAPPQRPELGSRFGPFSPVAEWLVRTESMSLVGITGLIGFGLLGAAASTIIRESGGKPTGGKPLVSDLPLLLVRGLTAAIVVFLAIKGGLTVFSETPAEPNPYVLLLTCLVAAVFSEPVWEAARVYLTTLVSRWGQSAPPANPSGGAGDKPAAGATTTQGGEPAAENQPPS